MPYASMYGNYLLWTCYGVMKQYAFVFVLNFLGLVLSIYYVTLLYRYVWNPNQCSHVVWFVIFSTTVAATLSGAVYYGLCTPEFFGLVPCLFALILFASPLMMLSRVINNKSTEGLSLAYALLIFFMNTCWFGYGYLLADPLIYVPNILGVLLAVVQLSLFCLYGVSPKDTDAK
eukprot:TRINITY_DN3562_c0_g1_i2.p1 TRINITY_DN3562_c0_g1~~TRINITY_DN3562_c0_g1_i2.p1  ORF type:complete len:174 (-),score=19.82 TRINITY_DN3562_c0_g1_i2:36-557(-)